MVATNAALTSLVSRSERIKSRQTLRSGSTVFTLTSSAPESPRERGSSLRPPTALFLIGESLALVCGGTNFRKHGLADLLNPVFSPSLRMPGHRILAAAEFCSGR